MTRSPKWIESGPEALAAMPLLKSKCDCLGIYCAMGFLRWVPVGLKIRPCGQTAVAVNWLYS